ncbi:MAG: hypothetical protein K1X94_07180 [Sandaracinaceae bacterium]|nr:hypothetical protein [Sandaracinaceae bacterium]
MVSCLAASPAAAQSEGAIAPPPPAERAEPPEYAALIDGALTEFQAGRWTEARALFERAHASFPNARTQRGIGMASFEMGDYGAAIAALEAALASEVRPLTEEQRTQVGALLERARALVGRFVVPPAASDVRLSVDGVVTRPDGAWPAAQGHVLLSVGTHEIVLRDGDGRTARTRIVVHGGEVDAPIDVTPPQGNEAEREHESQASEPTPWIVAGVGAALVIVGGVLYGVGASDIAHVNSSPSGTEWSSVSGVYDRAPILTGTGIASLIAGGAAAIVGLGWGLGVAMSSSSGPSAHVRLLPTGLALEGTF